MTKTVYELIEKYMLHCMNDSAHDKEHVYRVLYTAIDIAGHETNVDYDVLITACLLHDIGRQEQFENPSLCHAEVGAKKAFQFLIDNNFDKEFVEKVCHCILCHRFRNNNIPQSLEAKILFDADKMDATGAIGIARTLIYKGQISEPLYTCDSEGRVLDGTMDTEPSFFQEYKYKLEKVYDNFFINYSKELAKKRQKAAVNYYESILSEVKGFYEKGNIALKKRITDSLGEKYRLLLFDLDGTLLQSDKTISNRTLSALKQCREKGILIGVSTSRSEQNSMIFLNELMPDILITSGGALVKNGAEYIYKAEFTKNETRDMINMAKTVCGEDCEITIDTIVSHYWNYKIAPKKFDQSWGDSIYTDFTDFSECALKMCVEIFDSDKADILAKKLKQCDCIRFSDGFWYKFTKKNVTKENAIIRITEVCGFGTESIIAFGDDFADIGMLEICGVGVAMGNAIDEVKSRANIVIGSNDEEGIAYFIEENILNI